MPGSDHLHLLTSGREGEKREAERILEQQSECVVGEAALLFGASLFLATTAMLRR